MRIADGSLKRKNSQNIRCKLFPIKLSLFTLWFCIFYTIHFYSLKIYAVIHYGVFYIYSSLNLILSVSKCSIPTNRLIRVSKIVVALNYQTVKSRLGKTGYQLCHILLCGAEGNNRNEES